MVEGNVDVEVVTGYAAAVCARRILSGDNKADAKAKHREPGVKFTGIDTDMIDS
jgi:hypothetical protein